VAKRTAKSTKTKLLEELASSDAEFMRLLRRHIAHRNDGILKDHIEKEHGWSFLPGLAHEDPMAVVIDRLRDLGERDTPVIIEGPPGAGRLTAALVVRDLEESVESPWIVLPCAGTSPDQLTAAASPGCVLLLREIDKADIRFQRTLLGIMDEASSTRPRRVVCTTSCDLSELVKESAFDGVLYQKLNLGDRIAIPPLLERKWDIPALVVSAIKHADPDGSIRFITYAALHCLMELNWTGNVQQQLQLVEKLVGRTRCEHGDKLTLKAIENRFRRATPSRQTGSLSETWSDDRLDRLQTWGSTEMAAFAEQQYQDRVYSYPLEDRDYEGGRFDRDLWTGCRAVVADSTTAWKLYRYMQRAARIKEETVTSSRPQDVPAVTPVDNGTAATLEYWSREASFLDELSQHVKPWALDDSYGIAPEPCESTYGRVILVELLFSQLFASPRWLMDEKWVLRDSWKVPLAWADKRILFDVQRMTEDLREFLCTWPSQESIAVSRRATAPVVDEVETTAMEEQPPENRFAFDGVAWTISFQGKTIRERDKIGLHYIQALLRSPGRWIGAAELRALFADPVAPTQEEGCAEAKADPSIPPVPHKPQPEETIDEKTRKECQIRMKNLDAEYLFAVNGGRLEEAERVDAERTQLANYLKAATGLRNQPRTFSDDESRAAQSVPRDIRYVYKSLKSKHSHLHDHLKEFITTGARLRYAPESPVDWITS
jgi:hypothetical protein